MKLLEERILRDGRILPGGILKVDGFLNHQIDPQLLYEMALELKRLYAGERISKILTIEASGIAIAAMVGYVFGCPLVFAKKSKTRNISDSVYAVEVESFTHGNTNTVMVSREYLHPGDRVLIVDDFLATGAALVGLRALCEQAGAEAPADRVEDQRHHSQHHRPAPWHFPQLDEAQYLGDSHHDRALDQRAQRCSFVHKNDLLS